MTAQKKCENFKACFSSFMRSLSWINWMVDQKNLFVFKILAVCSFSFPFSELEDIGVSYSGNIPAA